MDFTYDYFGLILVVFMVSVAMTTGEDNELIINKPELDTRVKILGQSGKVMMAPSDGHPLTSSPDLVTMEIDSVQELDADGIAIVGGSDKHVFNTFASQDFSIGGVRRETLQALDSEYFEFTANLEDKQTVITVGVYIFKQAGELVFAGEKQTVEVGTVKWSVLLKDWEWCNPCPIGGTDYTGEFVDFTISLHGRDAAKHVPSGSDNTADYKLGQLTRLKLSKKYKTGMMWKEMDPGYPHIETQGARTLVTLRFKREAYLDFFYDPSITFGTGSTRIISFSCLCICLLIGVNNWV